MWLSNVWNEGMQVVQLFIMRVLKLICFFQHYLGHFPHSFNGVFSSSMVLINCIKVSKFRLIFPMIEFLFDEFLIHSMCSKKVVVSVDKLLWSERFF